MGQIKAWYIAIILGLSGPVSQNYIAPIDGAVNSHSWAHQLAVVEDPTDHPLVK